MATVTHRLSHEDTVDAISFTSASFTPAASELLVVWVLVSNTDASPTLSDTQGLGWSLIMSVIHGPLSGRRLHCYVSNALAANSSMTVTYTGSTTSTFVCIGVEGVSGITVGTGATALRQTASDPLRASNQACVITFASACLTTNPVVACEVNGANPAGQTPPTGFTEDADFGGATPNHGMECIHVDSGFTGTTMTWGGFSGASGGCAVAFEIDASAAAAGGVTYAAPRTAQWRDPGETFWVQKDRRDANLVATAANPLVTPLDSAWQAGGRYWHLYGDTALRPWRPQQRPYVSDPSLLAVAPSAIPGGVPRSVPGRDYGEVQWAQRRTTDTTLLATSLLENELLGSGDTARHYNTAVSNGDRREVPQQRIYFDPSLLATADLENELLGAGDAARHYGVAATNVDRREVPQQRIFFDPSLLASAQLENGLLGGADTSRHTAVFTDRREVPAQRVYTDLSLLASAELENELLGGSDVGRHYGVAASNVDRREVPQQRTYFDLSLLASGELENELLGGADTGKRYAAAATHGPRWWMPRQPKREATTPGLLDTAELENELLGGADVGRHTLAPAWYDRRLVPQQPLRESVPGLLDTAELEGVLLGGGDTIRRYLTAATNVDRRSVGAQRPYVSDPNLLLTALLENELLGSADDLRRRYLQPAEMVDRRETVGWQPRWPDPNLLSPPVDLDPTLAGWAVVWQTYNTAAEHVDRREVPQQRAYISDPSFYPTIAPIDPLTVAWGAGGPYWLLYNTVALQVDRRKVPQQRERESDPGLLLTALLENELLGGAETAKRYNLPASNVDRREVPAQRAYLSDPSLTLPLVDPTLNGWQAAWQTHNAAALFVDRREVPTQRPYISYPSIYPADPLTFTWGVGGAYWLSYNGAALNVSRRLVPQQPERESDPNLLLSALLENELLGGGDTSRHAAVFTDRRQTGGYQPRWPGPGLNIPATDPLTLAAGIGGDLWRRYNTAITNADRRETATQPLRLYLDPGPALPPLSLAWGAGGGYWHRYNRAWQFDRWPWIRWTHLLGAPHTCIVLRPGTGVTTRPGTGTTVYALVVTTRPGTGTTLRPDTGTTVDPC